MNLTNEKRKETEGEHKQSCFHVEKLKRACTVSLVIMAISLRSREREVCRKPPKTNAHTLSDHPHPNPKTQAPTPDRTRQGTHILKNGDA